jgi:hypothetical protein
MLKTRLPIRLAIRREGEVVNAYIAHPHTMKDATLIGSIGRKVALKADFFERWKALMSDILVAFIKDVYGQTPTIEEKGAPEHERSGNA